MKPTVSWQNKKKTNYYHLLPSRILRPYLPPCPTILFIYFLFTNFTFFVFYFVCVCVFGNLALLNVWAGCKDITGSCSFSIDRFHFVTATWLLLGNRSQISTSTIISFFHLISIIIIVIIVVIMDIVDCPRCLSIVSSLVVAAVVNNAGRCAAR